MSKMQEIGVDPNPPEKGEYEVSVENIMFCGPQFLYFDGEKWDIPVEFQNRKIWWFANDWHFIHEELSSLKVCKNKVNGVCRLHNLFCQFPECTR